MNEMGYRAAAVGNHEFDFGLETLTELAAAAEFPFLSANIRYLDNGTTPVDLGIESYSIVTVNDLRVGIIGLTTTSTPRTTNPVNVSEFEFWDYETALRDILPLVEGEGVDLILVPGHICQDEAISLAEKVADLPIDMIGGGHCNELFAEEVAGITVLEGGTAFGSYARATFAYDRSADELVGVTMDVNVNVGGTADPTIAAIVDGWQQATDEVLNQVIGYSEKGIARRSPEMQALITESWLVAFPTADVAVTNLGGMRADLPPGEITLADILTVMPFENVIVEVLITGEQLDTLLGYNSATFAGVYRESFRWHLNSTESEIEEDALYAVLVSDFMYAGGDEYRQLAQWDPNGYDTSVSWRQPVIDWIEAQDSSPDNPLDKAIEDLLP
jgi:2',3'-cyclic-nucleotide 2'-phosphodiesterase (5'-nucleotidase family)